MTFDQNKMMDLVKAAQKASNRSSAPLAPLLDALDAGRWRWDGEDLVQRALDKIDVVDARAFKDALSYVVNENSQTCYTGVVSFTPSLERTTARWAGWQDDDYGYYYSPTFRCEATVFCIAPEQVKVRGSQQVYKIGFIQDCTSMVDQADYADGSAERTHWPNGDPSPTFPYNDTFPSGRQTPWLGSKKLDGNQYQDDSKVPCAVELQTLNGKDLDLFMWDRFNNNSFGRWAPDTNNVPSVKFLREQAFKVWLACALLDSNDKLIELRMFRQVNYTNSTALIWDSNDPPRVDTNKSKMDLVKTGTNTDQRDLDVPIIPPKNQRHLEKRRPGSKAWEDEGTLQ
jgi:hypothetical protein